MASRSPFLNLQFSIIVTDIAVSSSVSDIRIPNAARATKTKLEMIWTQVEQNSLLIVVDDRSGNLALLYRYCLHLHMAISVPIKIGAAQNS